MRPIAAALLSLALLAGGCAPLRPTPLDGLLRHLPPGAPLLLGEQHDAEEHQQLARQALEWLAGRRQLAALVLEMAERGTDTRGLAPGATEDEVQARLRWNADGWPWARYGPVVMAAVRADVPVLGGNLPRAAMRDAMADTTLDATLPAAARQAQAASIRDGHCGLLPEAQLPAMVRIQIARDRALARTLIEAAEAAGPTRHVLLLAGGFHVHRELGVPAHLPPPLAQRARVEVMAPRDTGVDHCAALRRSLGR